MLVRKDFIRSKEIKPTFSDYDLNGSLKLSSILRYASDLASEDYADRGLSWTVLQAQGLVFLLSRMTLRVHRVIREGETLTFETYERGAEGPYCIRHYNALREDGSAAFSAKSAWIICEPSSRRILRPSDLPEPIESHPDRDVDCAEPHRIHLPKDMTYAGDRPVVYSDIDANGHVNNSVYAAIACDFLPEELQKRPMRGFAVIFRQEAKPGETLRITRSASDGSAVVSGTVGTAPCFDCQFDWE